MPAVPSSPEATAPFQLTVRVYWEDTDAGGIVFYANYLRFMERARTEWLRAAGVEQQALADRSGLIFVVSDVRLRYLHSARLDDLVTVTVRPTELGRARMVIEQQCLRGDRVLCAGQVTIACVDRERHVPRRIPPELLACLPPAAAPAE